MESPQVEPDTAQDLAVERERLSWTILEFASLTLAMAGSLAALFMIFIVGDAAETVWITPVLLPIAAFLSVPVAMRMGLPLRVGQILFFGIALATITGFAFVERSATLSGYLLFLPILITISGMILDRRGIIAVTAASLAIGVLSLWWDLRQQPILLDLSEPAPIFTFGIRNLVAIGFAALITLIALNIFSTLVARLRDARDRASETARARTEFLSSLSHEVRTPLNAIIGLSEILSREELEDDNLRKIDTISGAGRALLAVLDDVLDAARIEAGQMRINPVVTDIESLVFSVADLWGPVAEEKGLSFRVELDEAVPETLVLDRSRVRQCLNNLLSNAIKFTDAGQVSLGITWRGEAGRDAVLECAVRDSGSGMSPAEVAAAFACFRRGGAAHAPGSGFGLGLSITNDLARLMGGALEIETEAGHGSAFTLRIPARRAPLGSKAEPAETEDAAGAALASTQRIAPAEPTGAGGSAQVVTLPRAPAVDNLAVVVADDIASNRLVLVEMLRTLGYEPIEAESGAEAVEALKSSGARLAFLDRHMPGTDGLWALRRIADDPGLGAVRSIVISASANARSEERLRAARALAVLEKPLTLRMVGEAARDALED